MFRALYTASSGMDAQQRNIDVMANNIANVNTVGFRAGRAEFSELLYQQVRPAAGGAPTGVEVGLGVQTASTQRNFAQGDLQNTGNPLDVAIEGPGFLHVMSESGESAYTRDGSLRVDADGRLVTQDGGEIFPPISIPPDAVSVSIGRDGVVSVEMPGDPAPLEVGQLELTNFPNPAGLRSLGRNLFAPTEASGLATSGMPSEGGLGALSQGFLEGSNVNVVEEMVKMIVSQRSYEINSKVIRTADEMLRAASSIR